MYAGGDSQMNGDMPHDGGHGGGGHAVGDELKKTGKYEELNKFIFLKCKSKSTALSIYRETFLQNARWHKMMLD